MPLSTETVSSKLQGRSARMRSIRNLSKMSNLLYLRSLTRAFLSPHSCPNYESEILVVFLRIYIIHLNGAD